jgi:triacylglycerol lipase
LFGLLALVACASLDATELAKIGNRIDPSAINFRELYDYGARAQAAYRSEAEIRRRYPMTVRVAVPSNSGIQYFLEQDHQARAQFVTVRGSVDSINFNEDFEFSLNVDGRAKIPIHHGFDQAAQLVYADLKPHLAPGYRTNLTGHSLGAAVSAVMMLYMIEDGVNVSRMVGFGQPRFTTERGAAAYSRLPIIRVVDANDVVPMLPPSTLLHPEYGPYAQVGPEVILLDGSKFVYLDAHDADRISIGEFWRSISLVNLHDHSITGYLKRLSAKLAGADAVAYASRERYIARRSGSNVVLVRQAS